MSRQRGRSLPAVPTPASPAAEPVVSYTPLEEYAQALSVAKGEYEASVAQLGDTLEERLAKKTEWKEAADRAIAQLLTLTVSAEDRKKHQDRIILLTQLSQELGKESPGAPLLERVEKELPRLW